MNIIKKVSAFLEPYCGSDLKKYLMDPLTEGVHYSIGGVSEILDYTMEIDSDHAFKVNKNNSDSLFTLHWIVDINTDSKNPNRGTVVQKKNYSAFMALIRKVGPQAILISGWILHDEDIVMYPCFGIISTNGKFRNKDDIFQKIDNKDFVGVLDEIEEPKIKNDFSIFNMVDDKSNSEDFIHQVYDIFCRFLIIKSQFKNVTVYPNSIIKAKGFIALPKLEKEYTLLTKDSKFLGYSRLSPEVEI